MRRGEAVRLGRQQHPARHGVLRRMAHRRPIDFRVARPVGRGRALPAHRGEHRGDVGRPRHRHPRLTPDQVQHALQRQRGTHRGGLVERRLQLRGERPGLGVLAEHAAEQAVEREVVFRHARMGDDHMGHEGRQLLHRFAPVLVDIDDQMGRRQRPHRLHLDVLGAADLGDRTQHCARMDAEAGAPDQLRAQAQLAHQFGQRRDQGNDARLARETRMKRAQRVAKTPRFKSHEKGA